MALVVVHVAAVALAANANTAAELTDSVKINLAAVAAQEAEAAAAAAVAAPEVQLQYIILLLLLNTYMELHNTAPTKRRVPAAKFLEKHQELAACHATLIKDLEPVMPLVAIGLVANACKNNHVKILDYLPLKGIIILKITLPFFLIIDKNFMQWMDWILI